MRAAVARIPEMILLSDVPGRQRWRLPAIDSKPRLAAAVELALRKESGAVLVKVNPLTGRILLKWHPSQRPPEIRSIVRKALDKGPVSRSGLPETPRHAGPQGPEADQQTRSRRHQANTDSLQPCHLGRRWNRSSCRSHHGHLDFGHHYHRIRFSEGPVPNGNRPKRYHDRHPHWRGNVVEHRAERKRHRADRDLAAESRRVPGRGDAPAHAGRDSRAAVNRRRRDLGMGERR